jgi:hypothetical protein
MSNWKCQNTFLSMYTITAVICPLGDTHKGRSGGRLWNMREDYLKYGACKIVQHAVGGKEFLIFKNQ